ncbi:MAG: hypothetical protein R3B13_34075 [Polyangiaceae bacterium]
MVRLPLSEALTVPQLCACCGADSARAVRVRRGSLDLFVPYCEGCLVHASSGMTRDLASFLASGLLALTLAFALPLWFEWIPFWLHVCCTAGLALLPLVFRYVLAPRRLAPHTTTHLAAWWRSDGALACTFPPFAEALARANGVEVELASLREPGPRRSVWFAPALGLLLAPVSHRLHFPTVRVVNLTDDRITVRVDGREVCSVEATSAESPAAGAEVRVPAGRRELAVSGPQGRAVMTARVDVQAGARHLFAPGSEAVCFWLEETAYGRGAQEEQVVPLTGAARFWRIPDAVDLWFVPTPQAAPDRRSSGGTLMALRQAPCARAPRAVQVAAGLASSRE